MRSWRVLLAVVITLFAALWALSYVVPAAVASAFFALFIIGVGLWVKRSAARRRRRGGADSPDAVER